MKAKGFGANETPKKAPETEVPVNPSNFMHEYVSRVVLATKEEMGMVAAWLLANAQCMRDTMFHNTQVDWTALEPYHILALRACTPSNVFTETAKAWYLTRVSGDRDRVNLADCMFARIENDFHFVTSLPDSEKDLQPQIIQLVQLAYRKGIRFPDPRVRDM